MPELVDSLNCPKCGGPLRLAVGEVIVTCRYCGTVYRHPYMREQKALRKRRASAG